MAGMTNDELREFLCTRIRPAVLDYCEPDSCLVTAKVTLEVLRAAGVPARPWPCSLLVANQMAAPVYLRDMTDDEMAEVVAAGGHAVEVLGRGGRKRNGNWDGHMVVLADFDDVRHLLDFSLDQAKRSTWRINVGPVAVPLHPVTTTDEAVFSWVGDSMVRWRPIKDTSWRAAKAWKSNVPASTIAGALIRELRLEHADAE